MAVVSVFVTHTVNNVGMTCSDNFAYFLEIPEAEQVSFALQMSFSEDCMIYFYCLRLLEVTFVSDVEVTCFSCVFILTENHSDYQL